MRNKIYIIIFLVLIAGLIGFLVWQGSKNNQASPELVAFAKCLTEKGAVMYGTAWCEWCQKEKALFSNSFKFVNYVDCSQKPQDCVAKGINATPTWIFGDPPATTSSGDFGRGDKKIENYLTLEQLSTESGCALPK